MRAIKGKDEKGRGDEQTFSGAEKNGKLGCKEKEKIFREAVGNKRIKTDFSIFLNGETATLQISLNLIIKRLRFITSSIRIHRF